MIQPEFTPDKHIQNNYKIKRTTQTKPDNQRFVKNSDANNLLNRFLIQKDLNTNVETRDQRLMRITSEKQLPAKDVRIRNKNHTAAVKNLAPLESTIKPKNIPAFSYTHSKIAATEEKTNQLKMELTRGKFRESQSDYNLHSHRSKNLSLSPQMRNNSAIDVYIKKNNIKNASVNDNIHGYKEFSFYELQKKKTHNHLVEFDESQKTKKLKVDSDTVQKYQSLLGRNIPNKLAINRKQPYINNNAQQHPRNKVKLQQIKTSVCDLNSNPQSIIEINKIDQ